MIFGETPIDAAEGAILAHSLRAGKLVFKKGRVLSPDDIAALRDAAIDTVVAARLEDGDVVEDAAATRVAAALSGINLSASAAFTGRVNLFAEQRGILVVDPILEDLNRVDEAVTAATLPAWSLVEPKQMAATIKIIPFAVPEAVIARCETLAERPEGLLRVMPLQAKTVGFIQTRLAGTKDSVLDKTHAVLDARLQALESTLKREIRCAHDSAEVTQAIRACLDDGCDMVLIAGASAITDRRDVIPAAIEAAGGEIDHFGMPVDPGNLLMLGHIGPASAVGLPGCARSPKFNGVDWVLQRLCADIPIARDDIMAMGVGGLLKEMTGRPQPRASAPDDVDVAKAPRIACVILAAGQSRRMGRTNKLLATIDGKPMVRWAAEAALASAADPVLVVVGHEAEKVRAALADLPVIFVENPDYAAGISTSVRRGVAALKAGIDGVAVCLGDMPRISAGQIDRLIAAYDPVEGRALCIPTWRGKRGNPVLIGSRFFTELQEITGDVGARPLISQYPELICEVDMGDDAVLLDIDTPQALEALGS